MPEKTIDPIAAHQVELAVSQLDSLSVLPCAGARFFSLLLQPQPSLSSLAEVIESDPALAARIFCLIHQQGIDPADENLLIRRALDKLSIDTIRTSFLPVKVPYAFEADADNRSILPKKQLVLHSLAVACCAKDIAEILPLRVDSQLAYFAGLLHDIGKLALHQTMPKSLAGITQEAKSQNLCICDVERKHLGTDHTILGKRLAQKWHLPGQIILAVWLHHSNTAAISQNMPGARIAQVVQLADSISRQCGIGQSGSYDVPNSLEQAAQSLSINAGQLEQIRQRLSETVTRKSKALGLDIPRPEMTYFDAIHGTAVQLTNENSKLSLENRRLQTSQSQLDFITEFLLSINSSALPIEIAENFAVRWQKFYQTGMVCLYLTASDGSEMLEAVIVENLAQSRIVRLNVPADFPPLPKAFENKFAILNAHDNIDWLFEQLDIDFDPRQTKIIPLISDGKAVGAIIFELRYPGDLDLFKEQFRMSASIAGSVLDMSGVSAEQQHFAEQFGQLLSRPKITKPQAVSTGSLDALAEMAAGAAHELNNPLSVISGQAQLLAGSETEPAKKQVLKKIQENSHEISAIIEELMDFARPAPPRPAKINIRQILDEATQLAAQKTHSEHINVQTDIADGVEAVFVDSAQIVSAIANIISNSIESYTGSLGPIKVTAAGVELGDCVRLQIADLGCGMDAETLRKATQPFFSARPAGRKRGMGLSYAARLIELNGGSIELESWPGKGTSATISLPRSGTS